MACIIVIFQSFRDDGTPQDFEAREHVQRIDFQELLHHFKSMQEKHSKNKNARAKNQAKFQLMSI